MILGFGNDILSDDGIGLRLARDASEELDVPWVRCSMYGFDILTEIAGYSRVVIIDSLVESEAEPGEIFTFDLDDFSGCRHISSPHTTNFASGIEFGETTGLDLPDEYFIYGVNVCETVEFSEELSPELQEKYPQIKKKIITKISNLVK